MKNALILMLLGLILTPTIGQNHSFKPGEKWPDTAGNHINAHGGGILYYEGRYYWFGEHKGAKATALTGVSCYTSTDLYNWKYEDIVLTVEDDSTSEITKGCILERPKVIYNSRTKKFVMWFHLELKDQGYSAARTGVAVSENPLGPFKYVRSYRPNANTWPINFKEEWKNKKVNESDLKWWTPEWRKEVEQGLLLRKDFAKGQMSRDMTVFVDDDGKAYHIHSAEENLTLNISELSDDYLSFTDKWATFMPGGHNEAPAIIKRNGKYYMITSGCTGWAPNAARSFVASSIFGPWQYLGNPAKGEGEDLTFNSQSTFILPVVGQPNTLIFMADRWNPKNLAESSYVWLSLVFEDEKPVIKWLAEWKLK